MPLRDIIVHIEELSDRLAVKIVERIDREVDAWGTRPIDSRKATPTEQIADYIQNRDNVDFWRALRDNIQDFPELGDSLPVRKANIVRYAREMEKLLVEYGLRAPIEE